MAHAQKGNGGENGTAAVSLPNPRIIKLFGAFVLFLFLLAVVSKASGWLVDWLWMKELGYSPLFLRLIWIKLLLFAAAAVPVFLYLWINLKIAAGRQKGGFLRVQGPQDADIYEFHTKPLRIGLLGFIVSLVFALLFGLAFSADWDTFIRCFWGGSFGRPDPLFGLDIGFYMFRLPALEAIQKSLAVPHLPCNALHLPRLPGEPAGRAECRLFQERADVRRTCRSCSSFFSSYGGAATALTCSGCSTKSGGPSSGRATRTTTSCVPASGP